MNSSQRTREKKRFDTRSCSFEELFSTLSKWEGQGGRGSCRVLRTSRPLRAFKTQKTFLGVQTFKKAKMPLVSAQKEGPSSNV